MDLADPKWKGKIGLAQGETDFQPIVTSIVKTYGKQAAPHLARRGQGQRRKQRLSRQRDPDNEVNKGHAEIGIINSYYWYRLLEPNGCGRHALGHRLPSLPATPATWSTSPGPASSTPASTRPQPRSSWPSWSAKGQEIIAHSDSYEYPIGSGVTTARQLNRSAAATGAVDHRPAGRRLHRHRSAATGPAGSDPLT